MKGVKIYTKIVASLHVDLDQSYLCLISSSPSIISQVSPKVSPWALTKIS